MSHDSSSAQSSLESRLRDLVVGDDYVALPEGKFQYFYVNLITTPSNTFSNRLKLQFANRQPGPSISADEVEPVPYQPDHPLVTFDTRRRSARPVKPVFSISYGVQPNTSVLPNPNFDNNNYNNNNRPSSNGLPEVKNITGAPVAAPKSIINKRQPDAVTRPIIAARPQIIPPQNLPPQNTRYVPNPAPIRLPSNGFSQINTQRAPVPPPRAMNNKQSHTKRPNYAIPQPVPQAPINPFPDPRYLNNSSQSGRSPYQDFLNLAQSSIPGIDLNELMVRINTDPSQPIHINIPNGINAAAIQWQLQASLELAAAHFNARNSPFPPINNPNFIPNQMPYLFGQPPQFNNQMGLPNQQPVPPPAPPVIPPPVVKPPPPPSEDDMAEQDMDADVDQDEDFQEVETYADYVPAKLKFGLPHPDPVVETSSLSTVEPPEIDYTLKLPDKVIERGYLSALQLETVIYASQQHKQFLPDNKTRRGFLIGDGAGVGKGRQIAGIIYENFLAGRKKAIWLSVSSDLRLDAVRDFSDIGAKAVLVYPLSKFPYGRKIDAHQGVVFTTYSGLVSKSQNTKGTYGSRINQLINWAGTNFEGVIVFDECHKAKNICVSTKNKKTQSKAAEFVLDLQKRLPKARIVYASATGASETRHLGYMVRLGIWGHGTPYVNFAHFCESIEKGGVGAMELVAVDLKMRGAYIARQLSFKTTSFNIHIANLDGQFVKLYDDCVALWSLALEHFNTAACLLGDKNKKMRSMWATFWAAHQRFFKYLCIGAKVPHVVEIAMKALEEGKCVVVGLQSTGEAKTIEALEEGDINDFISTARATFESLIDNHFPAPDSSRRQRSEKTPSVTSSASSASSAMTKFVKTISKNEQILKDLIEQKKKQQKLNPKSSRAQRLARRRGECNQRKSRIRLLDNSSSDDDLTNPLSRDSSDESSLSSTNEDKSTSDTSYKATSSSTSDHDEGDETEVGSENDELVITPEELKKDTDAQEPGTSSSKKRLLDTDSDDSDVQITAVKRRAPDVIILSSGESELDDDLDELDPIMEHGVKLSAMREELYKGIDSLGPRLPTNTLDDLIDRLGGPSRVAEMTGRKGHVVKTHDGQVIYKNRNDNDALDELNVREKKRFMDGEKLVAIISEAASSGISLQADKRVKNARRRVHITIELPWSADRAIQQFGRTHRSNQVSGPEYVFVISELSGERRFASIVAKRLESLGALTHGDRRATCESRDLSQFNITGKYCKHALEILCLYIETKRCGVKVQLDYDGDFFKDAKLAYKDCGLGRVTGDLMIHEPQALSVNHFLNRLLGMRVHIQNAIFKLFTDIMDRLILRDKVRGMHDTGILELNNDSGSTQIENTENYNLKTAGGSVKCSLRSVLVERGISWNQAIEKLKECEKEDSRNGFYLSYNPITKAQMVSLLIREPSSGIDLFRAYKPNTGKQQKPEFYSVLSGRLERVGPPRAQPIWTKIYEFTDKNCVHLCLFNSCKRLQAKMRCDMGLRHRRYCVLSGGILTAWPYLESKIPDLSKRLRIVRLKVDEHSRVIGPVIPQDSVDKVRTLLLAGQQHGLEFKHQQTDS